MLTEKQDREIFRAVFNFYCKHKNNGSDRDKWLICAEEVNALFEKYKGIKLAEALIKGVYAQMIDDNERS